MRAVRPFTASQMSPDDGDVLSRFLYDASRLLVHVTDDRVQEMLRAGYVYAVRSGGELACVCGLSIGPETIAQIRVFALQEGCDAGEALSILGPLIIPALSARGVTTLAFVGLDRWLLDGLSKNGFRQANRVVALQKTDFDVPARGNPSVVVRPVHRADLPTLLAIDEATFVPLWRNTIGSLNEAMSESARFCVAEHNWKVVGYQYLNLIGRHGHITRLAVHPRYQGKGIGARLLVDAIDFFQRKRVYGITLNTQQDNHRARQLYEWFGFVELGQEAQVMVLELPCSSPQLQV